MNILNPLSYIPGPKPKWGKVTPFQEINLGRFYRRLSFIASPDDCWIWGSSCVKSRGTRKKYPVFPLMAPDRTDKQTYARRWAWEQEHGSLEPGTSIVNICGEELCVRPDNKHQKVVLHGDWNKTPHIKRVPSEDEFLNTK